VTVYHADIVQGSDEWLEMRRGILTASEMKLIITPTLKTASNDKEKAHLYELAAQRITGYVEPQFISDDMLRGMDDEIDAKALYHEHYAPVEDIGFITNDLLGFTIGYSPDGLVGDDGLIEIKSRRQKYQMQTILTGMVPDEYMIQLQTGLWVSGRKWIDFISYSSGMPMFVKRVYPDAEYRAAILTAAMQFETRLIEVVDQYKEKSAKFVPTVRRVEQEILV